VLNEGGFSDPTGARLTLYDPAQDSVYRDVFESANNGRSLGNLGDDLVLHRGKAYILMSGSENLRVIDLASHREIMSAAYPGDTPHDLLIDSVRGKIYMTRLFKSSLLVVDLATLAIRDSIPVGNNPLGMVLLGGRLFVCNSGYGSDRTVTVIDAATDRPIRTVTVREGPASAAVGTDGRVWVACTGNAFGSPPSPGAVMVIDPASLAVTDSVLFTENLGGAIVGSGDGLLYLLGSTTGSFYGGPVHRIVESSRAVTTGFIPGTWYALAYDEAGGDVYTANARNFTSAGEVEVHSRDGSFRRRFAAQIGPGVIRFRR
jgi:YVTN family beta-propeller protein